MISDKRFAWRNRGRSDYLIFFQLKNLESCVLGVKIGGYIKCKLSQHQFAALSQGNIFGLRVNNDGVSQASFSSIELVRRDALISKKVIYLYTKVIAGTGKNILVRDTVSGSQRIFIILLGGRTIKRRGTVVDDGRGGMISGKGNC